MRISDKKMLIELERAQKTGVIGGCDIYADKIVIVSRKGEVLRSFIRNPGYTSRIVNFLEDLQALSHPARW